MNFSHNRILTLSTFWLLIICSIALPSCQRHSGYDEQDGLTVFSKDSLAHHIIILASDSFEGRRPFTIGETRTVNYLINNLKIMGLKQVMGIITTGSTIG